MSWAEDGEFLTRSRPQTAIIPATGTATLTADTVDDGTDEPVGSVTATVATGSGYTVGSPGSATVEVTDDDAPAPSIPRPRVPVVTVKADSDRVCEGTDAVFTLTATPAPASPLTVHFSLSYTSHLGLDLHIQSPIPYAGTVSISSSGKGKYRVATVDNDDESDSTWIVLTVDQGAGYVSGASFGRVIVVDNDTTVNSRECPTSAAT